MKHHPAPSGSFPVYSVFAESLDALAEALRPPCPRFVLLIAADTEDIAPSVLHAWAGRVLSRGAVYACCWGPGAEQLHFAFDMAAMDREPAEAAADGESVIMTTWHTDEPLLEAAWFAVHAAFPVGIYEAGTEAVVLAVVARPDWHAELTGYLDDGAPIRDAV
jgi:hypothetical protein